jgi:carbon-monoxide dehydrogenase medium subunit
MRSFEFHRPQSLADAVALLKANDSAKLLAGGQSLLPVMKLDLAEPAHLVSLGGIRGTWGGIHAEGDQLVVGALATHDEVAGSGEVKRLIPGLASLAAGIGDAQVRNRGTLGGSLAHADPAADYPAAVLALGATIVTDRRRIAADDFFTGLFTTALAPDEIVTAVHFPVPERAAYVKFPHRASKFAVAGVMVAVLPARAGGGVRVAVTGAGPRAFRIPALEAALAQRFAPEAVTPEVMASVAPADLLSDTEASAEYRAHLIAVMARRAVRACG